MILAADVVRFWVEEIGEEGWYKGGAEIDGKIRDRFEALWHDAMAGGCGTWLMDPAGALGYLILTDQFPRNMFRETGRAFASDPQARSAAKYAIGQGWDMQIAEPERQFFYLPLMHSENLVDQDRCVELIGERLPQSGADNLVHAKAHREVIRRFGRFPTRNVALDRATTTAEARWLAEGGYGAIVASLRDGSIG